MKRSMDAIQEMLVEGILKVYLSQGVVIADKHLEIIIRQMTSKVAITTPGRSGLFRGEYVAVDVVAKLIDPFLARRRRLSIDQFFVASPEPPSTPKAFCRLRVFRRRLAS